MYTSLLSVLPSVSSKIKKLRINISMYVTFGDLASFQNPFKVRPPRQNKNKVF